jgi:hypothetical protein
MGITINRTLSSKIKDYRAARFVVGGVEIVALLVSPLVVWFILGFFGEMIDLNKLVMLSMLIQGKAVVY